MIEKVQTKVLQRSGSKFAIVTFAQESQFLEVPLWPQVYERYGEFLREGKLVYAVFRIDVENEERRFSCRWLTDLEHLDEMAVSEAKEAKKLTLKEQRRVKKKESDKEANVLGSKDSLEIEVDLASLRASKVLQLKKLFRSAPGPSSVYLRLYFEKQELSTLAISAPWGVEITNFLTQSLEKVQGVKKVSSVSD